MIDTSTWATLSSPRCAVLAPANLGLHPTSRTPADSDLTFMVKATAVVDEVPVSTILSHRPRSLHLRAEMARTADALDEVLEEGPIDVPGGAGARCVRGVWQLEEALTPEGHELLTRVVVPLSREFASLVVRVPAGSSRGRALADAVVGSLVVVDPVDRRR